MYVCMYVFVLGMTLNCQLPLGGSSNDEFSSKGSPCECYFLHVINTLEDSRSYFLEKHVPGSEPRACKTVCKCCFVWSVGKGI